MPAKPAVLRAHSAFGALWQAKLAGHRGYCATPRTSFQPPGPWCIFRGAMPESIAPERLNRKSTSIAQLFAKRVKDTPDREAYRYPVGDQWRSLTWRQSGERVKAMAAGLLS